MGQVTIRLGPDGFETTSENEADVRDVMFAGRWSTPPIPDNRQAVHMLDLDPHEGELACWCYMRFGGPWIDVIVPPELPLHEKQAMQRNLPPSARGLDHVPPQVTYDVVHAGEDVEGGLVVLDRCKPMWFAAEWNSEADRKRIDDAAGKAGLRLFKIELRDADTGRGLWIRSAAEFDGGSYRLRAA